MGNCIQQQRVCLCLEMNTILCGIFQSTSWIIEKKWILQFVGLTDYNPVQASGQVMFVTYFRVYNKIIKDIKVPFNMVGGERVDDTPVHKALREALANCLINIGERAGSGVPNIFNVWNDEGFVEPEIEERFDPDRTILTLSFIKKRRKRNKNKRIDASINC